jgi:hypothetical protein
VPVLAARLADVLVADPEPAVLAGRQQHLLDQAAVLFLGVGAVAERPPRLGDPLGELVAELLELAQGQHPGSAARAHAPVEALPRPGRAEQLRQLLLEPRQLVEQGPSRRTLVRPGAGSDGLAHRRHGGRGSRLNDFGHVPPSGRLRRLYQRD